ncbi:hypothetical protein ACG3SL_15165 [Sphingomonas sp. CJ20]
MSTDSPEPEKPADQNTEARAAEAAAIRRRWITLGEVLGVVAVLISALTLWNNWSERSDSKAAESASAERASARAATLVLIAADSGERVLALKPTSADQTVQSQRIAFPSPLGIAAVETTGEPRIDVKWFDEPLKKARNAARLPDNSRGDERLPVLVTTQFLVNGEPHSDSALYDVGYTVSGKLLAGHSVTLRGISFVAAAKDKSAAAKLDERWKANFPTK